MDQRLIWGIVDGGNRSYVNTHERIETGWTP